MTFEDEVLATAAELAMVLRVDLRTVYRMTHRNEIPSTKVGRYYRYDIEAVKKHLATPPPSWAQSARSLGRKRAPIRSRMERTA